MQRALTDPDKGLGYMNLKADHEALEHIATMANGDIRRALNALELAAMTTPPDESGAVHITLEVAEESIRKPLVKADESTQYDVLSAFHKSIRGSSDAALFWFLYAVEKLGMDPMVFIRRLIAASSHIDQEKLLGIGLGSTNLRPVNGIVQLLEERFKVRVIEKNGADLAALGEYRKFNPDRGERLIYTTVRNVARIHFSAQPHESVQETVVYDRRFMNDSPLPVPLISKFRARDAAKSENVSLTPKLLGCFRAGL